MDYDTGSKNEGTSKCPLVQLNPNASSAQSTVKWNESEQHPHSTESAQHDVTAGNRDRVCTARERLSKPQTMF